MQRRHHLPRRGDPGPTGGALPPHFLLYSVSRPPFIQAAVTEGVAAGQVQRVLRLLEAYPARRFGGGGATQVFGHSLPICKLPSRTLPPLPTRPTSYSMVKKRSTAIIHHTVGPPRTRRRFTSLTPVQLTFRLDFWQTAEPPLPPPKKTQTRARVKQPKAPRGKSGKRGYRLANPVHFLNLIN